MPGRIGVGLRLRSVQSKAAKLTVDVKSGAGEMYDLGSDPDEMTNVFDNPGYALMKAELTDVLMARPGGMWPNQVQVGMA